MLCKISIFVSAGFHTFVFRLLVLILTVFVLLFATKRVEFQINPRSENDLPIKTCETGSVAAGRITDSLWLKNGGSIDRNEWMFCDGVMVFELANSNESETDFMKHLDSVLKSGLQTIDTGRLVSESQKGTRYLLRSSSETPEWILIVRKGNATNTFRGKSLVHIMLLESLRYCNKWGDVPASIP